MSGNFEEACCYEPWLGAEEERVKGALESAYFSYQVLSLALCKLSVGYERESMVFIIPDCGW